MTPQNDPKYAEVATRAFAGEKIKDYNPLEVLGPELMSEFQLAQSARQEVEERWLENLRQYKGQYDPAEESAMEGSKQFLRKTRVKVESVDARLTDLLFPANRERNFEIEATPEPSIPREKLQEIRALLTQAMQGQQPDKAMLKKAVREHVQSSAKAMASRIDDQLTEAQYKKVARAVIHSGNLYGLGILKGPLVERRTRINYVHVNGQYKQQPAEFSAPFLQDVPLWRWYPDMAVTELSDARYCWEHHRFSRAKFSDLARRKSFKADAIKAHIDTNPDGHIKLMTYEQDLRGLSDTKMRTTLAMRSGQYDVYERWGWLTGDQLRCAGIDVPPDRCHEAFFSNVWMLPCGTVIKAMLAPIDGVVWPYHLYYFDKDETSIFGEGLASIMAEDQRAINAAARMLLNNAAITSGPQFEVDLRAMATDTDITNIHPHKIWPRVDGDAQYPAVRALKFDSHITELVNILQLFDGNADETTAIPKFTYGDNSRAGGAADTAQGLSMLMGQANIAIKDQVANFDEVTVSFIRALYHWNMKFSRDSSIKGDYDVKARGASSMVAKEVRAQALSQYAATLQPEEREYIKWDKLARDKAEVMDLSGVTKSEDEVKEERDSPAAQSQAQMQEMAAKLQVANMEAEIAKKQAEAALTQAKAMAERVETIFASLQAAGIVVTNAGAGAAADQILRDSGWVDANPADGSVADLPEGEAIPQGTVQPQAPQDPNTGQRAGIETVAMGAGQ